MKFKDYCKKYLLSALFVIVAPLYLLIWIFLIPAIIMILLYSTVWLIWFLFNMFAWWNIFIVFGGLFITLFIGSCLIIKLAEVFESEW